MAGALIDRQRAARLLDEAGLDALVISEPEGFFYATGHSMGVAGLFRRAGAGFAVVPADPAKPVVAVVGDLAAPALRRSGMLVREHPLWIETAAIAADRHDVARAISQDWAVRRQPGFARPATFDLAASLAQLTALLTDAGLADKRLGLDLDFVPAADFAVIAAALPEARISNGSRTLATLRMVKQPEEIALLRQGTQLAEAGLREMAARAHTGIVQAGLSQAFRDGIAVKAVEQGVAIPPSWDYISVGAIPWGSGGPLAEGDVVKADVGCVINGYSSDSSRNFIFGQPSVAQAELHFMLEKAFEEGWQQIVPGKPLSQVHRVVTDSLRQAGLEGFTRGHFGHSLGQGQFCEQWPFISADSEEVFEPGMVMAFEVPIYVDGVGGFNIEDALLVTDTGAESLNTLPRSLVPIQP